MLLYETKQLSNFVFTIFYCYLAMLLDRWQLYFSTLHSRWNDTWFLRNSSDFFSQRYLKMGVEIDRKFFNMNLILKVWAARPRHYKDRVNPCSPEMIKLQWNLSIRLKSLLLTWKINWMLNPTLFLIIFYSAITSSNKLHMT